MIWAVSFGSSRVSSRKELSSIKSRLLIWKVHSFFLGVFLVGLRAESAVQLFCCILLGWEVSEVWAVAGKFGFESFDGCL